MPPVTADGAPNEILNTMRKKKFYGIPENVILTQQCYNSYKKKGLNKT